MAIDLLVKSAFITNAEATPPTIVSPQDGGAGVVKNVYGFIPAIAASLSATSRCRLCRVPSNARIKEVIFRSGAQAGGTFDVGVYYPTEKNSGAVIDADLFGSGIAVTSAVKSTNVIDESAELTIAEMAQPLWKAAGLSADPQCMLDIVATVATDITTGTAPISVSVDYVQ